ncbi:MAG TPA: IS110 family transposase [Chloroflexi bacterium]|nr:IS110 family transposase [Chloroflexota bacterium]
MRFYTGQHQYYCGVDLHARTLYVCVLDDTGTVRLHKRLPCDRARVVEALEPYRSDVVVGCECIFCWYWLADLCVAEEIAFVLGHALYMKAIHGGKAKNDKIDAHKTATLLRGGAFPMAFVYPPEMRATRDLLRRRLFFARKRGELFGHVRSTFQQYNKPFPSSGQLRYKKHREGLAEAFDDPALRATIEADLALADRYDTVLAELERIIEDQARVHDPEALELLRTIPGVGKILALTLLYEIHHIGRFDSVQKFSSYCRLVKSEHRSAGKRVGSGGAKIGNAHLKWAFSEAAVLFLKGNPRAQAHLKRLQRKHGKAKGLSILAARLGRSVYFILKNQEAFDMDRFFA